MSFATEVLFNLTKCALEGGYEVKLRDNPEVLSEGFIVYLPLSTELTIKVKSSIYLDKSAEYNLPFLPVVAKGSKTVILEDSPETTPEIEIPFEIYYFDPSRPETPFFPLRLEDLLDVDQMAIASPGHIRIYDSYGRVTGLIGEEVRQDIPNSIYDKKNKIITIFGATDSYYYEVTGTDTGLYGLTISSVENEEATIFTAFDIPTTNGQNHQYTIDWQLLAQGGEGVIVEIDADGDGVFEQSIMSDSELTQDEFILQTETIIDCAPDTLNLQSSGKWLTCYIELPQEYDVWQIDGSSVALNHASLAYLGKQGWAEAPSTDANVMDYDNDGILERMVKFNRVDVIETINTDEEEIELYLTGKLLYNQELIDFAGTDTIKVINNE